MWHRKHEGSEERSQVDDWDATTRSVWHPWTKGFLAAVFRFERSHFTMIRTGKDDSLSDKQLHLTVAALFSCYFKDPWNSFRVDAVPQASLSPHPHPTRHSLVSGTKIPVKYFVMFYPQGISLCAHHPTTMQFLDLLVCKAFWPGPSAVKTVHKTSFSHFFKKWCQ